MCRKRGICFCERRFCLKQSVTGGNISDYTKNYIYVNVKVIRITRLESSGYYNEQRCEKLYQKLDPTRTLESAEPIRAELSAGSSSLRASLNESYSRKCTFIHLVSRLQLIKVSIKNVFHNLVFHKVLHIVLISL